MARSPFLVSVAELRHERAEPKPVDITAPVDWHLELSRVLADPPLRAGLVLERVTGGILVRGTVEVTVRHTCRRCLDEWEEQVSLPVSQLYLNDPGDEADYVVDGPEIDLEPLLRDEALLELPLGPTCPDGCREVVAHDETGLNIPSPDDLGDAPSPFAVLKDLLDAGE